jgi:uncharacterized membrane protein
VEHAHSEVIAASPQECFDAIRAFETYPAWQGPVKAVDVRDDGTVAFEVDAKVRTIRYVLRYHFDEPVRVWWDYVEGDAKGVEGEYRFEDLGDGTTRATYALDIDPGGFVPGPVKKILRDQVMNASVRDLKTHLES